MYPRWIGKLDGGQLDAMWNFLRFHREKPSIGDIETLESHLDDLRTMMIQKNGGQEQYTGKTEGAVNFGDMETILNCIVIETMWIYLGGGLKMLKEVIQGAEC